MRKILPRGPLPRVPFKDASCTKKGGQGNDSTDESVPGVMRKICAASGSLLPVTTVARDS